MQLISVPVIPSLTDVQWKRLIPAGLSTKKLLVISTPFPTESTEASTLSRMMIACKLEADDYTLLLFETESPFSWAALKSSGLPPVVLLLGVSPVDLSIRALFQVGIVQDFSGVKLILAPSLRALEHDLEAKKRLWGGGLKPALRL
ncbi:MAG: hypothetical protein JST06_00415 [Bacteroidetes bacterium]|nr:hypothetical protein [Bacteroidota bacterium]MBS1629992.1 hypothetical protein [Bacteroidota bacterium]